MRNLSKILGIALAGIILITSQIIFANINNKNFIKQIKKTIYTNKMISKKVDENKNSSLDSSEAFVIENFGGNRSLQKTLVLNDTMGYWKIWVDNTGDSAIKVGITGQSGVTSVPAGEKCTIYSTGKWSAGNYTVTFVSGAGMYGSTYAKVAYEKNQLY